MRQLFKNIRRSSVVMILASKIRNIKSNLRNYLDRTYGEGSKYPKDVRRYEKSKEIRSPKKRITFEFAVCLQPVWKKIQTKS
ncbi:hypothetical protein WA026_020856 [Henosepilachna vigintioctopunctata]|uniref:Uncharacterized protein n=1 Tax=Henosepilachna vigintioctopunctata TaxID=420089 RepID=A0AAW1UQS8_9CUCU